MATYELITNIRGLGFHAGNGSPEGVVQAPKSDMYLQRDSVTTTGALWIKASGSGNTGWVIYSEAPAVDLAAEIQARIDGDQALQDQFDDLTAASVGFVPSGSISATDTQSAIAELDTETQAQFAALPAMYVTKAPAPTGNRVTDTANIQALIDAAQAGSGPRRTIILQEGTYAADLVTTRTTAQPKIVGQGMTRTLIDGTLKFVGTPGAFSGGYFSDLSFTGSHGSEAAVTIESACDVTWDRVRVTGTWAVGLLFHNKTSGDFTEMSAGQMHFDQGVATAVEYRVTSGNPSFHGSGLTTGSTINQAAADSGPKIKIGSGAEPYNAPLTAILWARTAVPLIRHDGEQTSSFFGDLKIELLPSNAKAVVCDPAGPRDLIYAGTVLRRGKRVEFGRLVVADSTVTTSGPTRGLAAGAQMDSMVAGAVQVINPDGQPEWVPKVRTNRASNPVAGDGTQYVSAYHADATVASATDSALGTTKLWTVTLGSSTNQNQGLIYLQPKTDLAQGQVKTICVDVLSTVDTTLYMGARWGLSGSPGIAETDAGVAYIAANTIQRIRRVVTVPAPNPAGTITHEGFFVRYNTSADVPNAGDVLKIGNITIEDGVTGGSRFSGEQYGSWNGTANQSTSVQYPTTADRIIEGTGSPEGVVTAKVGTEYVDRSATRGAIKWVKATGTGNTGWKVSYGDTGWRDVLTSITNGWTAALLKIRRVGNRVTIQAVTLNGAAASAASYWALPSGFRSSSYSVSPRYPLVLGSNALDTTRATFADSSLNVMSIGGAAYTGLTDGRVLAEWITDDDWPATLP